MAERMQGGSGQEAAWNRSQQGERKLIRVATMLVVYFGFSWIPLLVIIFINISCGDCVDKYVRCVTI